MATTAQYPATALAAWNATAITSANTAMDGTGTVVTLSRDGSTTPTIAANASVYLDYITALPMGTNVATAMRIFLNNGSTNATAANNTMIADATCPATTASNTAALAPIIIPVKKMITAGSNGANINITIGTAVSAGFNVTLYGGVF